MAIFKLFRANLFIKRKIIFFFFNRIIMIDLLEECSLPCMSWSIEYDTLHFRIMDSIFELIYILFSLYYHV